MTTDGWVGMTPMGRGVWKRRGDAVRQPRPQRVGVLFLLGRFLSLVSERLLCATGKSEDSIDEQNSPQSRTY